MLAGVDAQRAFGEVHPLVHPGQPKPVTPGVGVKARAVILHLYQKLAACLTDDYAYAVCTSVLGDVRERLLNQPVHGALELLLQAHLPRHGSWQRKLAVDLKAALLAVTVE